MCNICVKWYKDWCKAQRVRNKITSQISQMKQEEKKNNKKKEKFSWPGHV